MNLAQLNNQYSIPDQLKFIKGNNGLIFIDVDTGYAQATISTYGGQVLTFQPVNETEDLLFVSKLAHFEPGKAIRGGIPICWPWFGPDPTNSNGSAHGFVRTRQWNVRQTTLESDGAIKVVLALNDSDETLKIWPHSFDLSISITIRESLTLELITHNTSSIPFTLTQALHTYFNIKDCRQVNITGLEDTTYIDKTDDGNQKTQQGSVTISQEVDRIYTSAKPDLILEDTLPRTVKIHSKNSKTAIIWNPWKTKAAAMSDLNDNDYKTMVCVETANAGTDDEITLAGGSKHHLVAQYQII
jgi:glucose-6-phosphate 1-epimerase